MKSLALVCAVVLLHTEPGQQATFSASTRIVRVDVLVTQQGTPLAGLAAEDFEVFDNGVKQQVSLMSAEPLPLDVVLALDMSGSVEGLALKALRDAATATLRALAPEDHVALFALGPTVEQRSALTRDHGAVIAEIMKDGAGGDTALIDAMNGALLAADAGAGRPLIVVFSDGNDTASFLPASSVVESAGVVGAVVYGVTTGPFTRDTFLTDLTRKTGGRVIPLSNMARLEKTLVGILEEFRQRYLIGFVPTGVPAAGWHTLEIRVRRPRVEVTARPGYVK